MVIRSRFSGFSKSSDTKKIRHRSVGTVQEYFDYLPAIGSILPEHEIYVKYILPFQGKEFSYKDYSLFFYPIISHVNYEEPSMVELKGALAMFIYGAHTSQTFNCKLVHHKKLSTRLLDNAIIRLHAKGRIEHLQSFASTRKLACVKH